LLEKKYEDDLSASFNAKKSSFNLWILTCEIWSKISKRKKVRLRPNGDKKFASVDSLRKNKNFFFSLTLLSPAQTSPIKSLVESPWAWGLILRNHMVLHKCWFFLNLGRIMMGYHVPLTAISAKSQLNPNHNWTIHGLCLGTDDKVDILFKA